MRRWETAMWRDHGGIQAWQANPPAGHELQLVTTGPAARPATMFRLTSVGRNWGSSLLAGDQAALRVSR